MIDIAFHRLNFCPGYMID